MRKELLLAMILLPCVVWAEDLASPILSFEEMQLPGSLQTTGGSVVELTGRHYINGSQSLRWSWNGAAELVFDRAIPFVSDQKASDELKRGALCVFSFWVYNEHAMPGAKLRVDFGQADCGFDFGLDFTGWRTCSVAFTRDMQGTPKEGMRGLRIKAPDNAAAGEVFIDRIILANVDDIRYQWPDAQVPFVAGTDAAPMELTPVPVAAKSTPAEDAAVELVERRFEAGLIPEEPVSTTEVEAIEEQFRALEISEQDGSMHGRHVLMMRRLLHDRQDSVYPRKLSKEDELLLNQYVEMREYTDLMQRVAEAYRSRPPSNPEAEKLRAIFILMSQHLLDQGWQYGSALYSTHHFGYASRGWYVAVFLMRDELQKAGLLDPTVRALIWYMREKVDFAKMQYNPGEEVDLDYLNTIAKSHLMTVLSIPDSAPKTMLVKKFGVYLSDLLAADTPGTLGGIKPDGTAFHHGGNYPGYSFPAFRSSVEVCRIMNGTPFAVRPDALQNLNKALTAATIYSNPETGIGLCGRHPFGESSVSELEQTFADLEACGYPMQLDRGNKPSGHWSFNYGCFGIHRWGGKMVTLKGFNKYVWSSESYTADNRYGRYQSNGGVQIYTSGGRAASGFEEDGWDWNRNPGTTAIHLPLDQLENPNQGTLMYRSDVRFSGSSNLGGRYGIFAVELQEPDMPNFDPTFTARKSMFCFDNRIICLGAGIANQTEQYPTETVLFQHTWKEVSSKVWMNAEEPVSALPSSKISTDKTWLVDGFGNGYYVAPGSRINLSVSQQQSRQNKTKEPTTGMFAAAWIDHGKAPVDASYEYAIVLDGTPEKMAAFSAAPPYRVIRNDSQAQIIFDQESGVAAYALFEPFVDDGKGLLVSADQPSLVMMRKSGRDLTMSVGNADLRIPAMGGSYTNSEESRPGYAEIVLRGTWKLDGSRNNIELKQEEGNTRITVSEILHAIPVQIKLVQN